MNQFHSNKWSLGVIVALAGVITLWLATGRGATEPAGKTLPPVSWSQKTNPDLKSYPLHAAPRTITVNVRQLRREIEGQKKSTDVRREDVEDGEALKSWAATVTVADMPIALKSLQARAPSEIGRDLTRTLIRRWADRDVRAAANWVQQMPADDARQDALNDVAIVWAERTPEAAIQWLCEWPVEAERRRGLLTVAYETARAEPVASLQLAAEQPAMPERDDLIQYAVMQWAATDPGAAVLWAMDIEDRALREKVLSKAVTVWGATSPAMAATIAAEAMAPGRSQDNAVMGIIERWVQTEPENVVAWVEDFPEGNLKRTAVAYVVKAWAERDVEQVGEWVSSLPDGAMRDTAMSAFAPWLTSAHTKIPALWEEKIRQSL